MSASPRSDFSDIVHSHAFGAARFGLPLLVYAVTYPLFIERYGLATFALWSLIFSISSAISLANFGFGDFFTREIAKARDADGRAEIKHQLRLARLLSLAAGVVIVAALLAIDAMGGVLSKSPYGATALLFTAILVSIAAIWSIQNRLGESVLRAHYANGVVELMQAIKQLVPISGLLVGVFAGKPLEIFAIALLAAEIGQSLVLRGYISRRLPEWRRIRPSPSRQSLRREISALLARSLPLYGLTLALICRDPGLRLVLAAQYGLVVAGSYEIAYRIGISCFNAANIGAASFLPSLARDLAERNQERALAKLTSLTVLMAGFALAIFGLALASCGFVIPLWIEAADAQALTFTRVMLVWLWCNALVVPVWSYLIATHAEKYLTGAVALHSLFALAAFVLGLASAPFLALWALAGLLLYVAAAMAAKWSGIGSFAFTPAQKRLLLAATLTFAGGVAVAMLQHWGVIASLAANLAALAVFLALGAISLLKSLGMLRAVAEDRS